MNTYKPKTQLMKALKSTDSSRWNTLESGPRPGPRPSGKGDPGPLELNLRVLISNMTTAF